MRPTPGRVLCAGLWKAATLRLNLWMAGIGASVAAVSESWALFGATLAGYTVAVGVDLARKAFWRDVLDDVRRRSPPLPDEYDLTDRDSRAALARAELARADREHAIERLPKSALKTVSPLLERASELEAELALLLRRASELSNHGAAEARHRLKAQAGHMKALMGEAEELALQTEYRRAGDALAEALRATGEIEGHRQTVLARMEAVVATLELVPWHIVRLRTAEQSAGGATSALDALLAELTAHPQPEPSPAQA